MPFKGGRLTPHERRFIEAMVQLGDAPAAAWKAKLGSPMVAGYRMMSKPAVRAEVTRLAEERLVTEMLPLALSAHQQLLTDKNVPAGARLGAVKLTYDRTLGADDKDPADKQPSEMTASELQASIAQLYRELDGRPDAARDVTPGPSSSIVDATPGGSVFD